MRPSSTASASPNDLSKGIRDEPLKSLGILDEQGNVLASISILGSGRD
jgi:hypothetical protein